MFVIAAVVVAGSQIQARQVPVAATSTPVVPLTPVEPAIAPVATISPVQVATPPTPPAVALPVQPTTPAPSRQGGRGAGTPPPAVPATPIAPGAATVPAPPRVERIPTQNVKVDLTITDTFGTGSTKKSVTLLVADGWSGRVRSSNEVFMQVAGAPQGATMPRQITINVDCTPIVRDNRIQLNLTIEYVPELGPNNPTANAPTTRDPKPANINESLTVLVNDGKPTLLTQSADPATDRRVTVEVTATVVK
jgi:hypothetical protein